MRSLFHFWLCPFSRKIRIVLAEKKLDFELKFEKYWERREGFLFLNPACQVPVLREENSLVIADSNSIFEYLNEVHSIPNLCGVDPVTRAEARRLTFWFDLKFYSEVTRPLIDEKVLKRFMSMGQPNSSIMRAARANIRTHLDYIGWLCERRNWLVGENFSIADIAAASHLSCIDYLGDVPWEEHSLAKDWYVRVKSRPSFRALLTDKILGLDAPEHYSDLDF
ncbi:glutathione S-transferase family protein [Alphaproteobacteria bacterium]|nr:glutathione S-transferase family protein [Alphaproteobacteria bacterium]